MTTQHTHSEHSDADLNVVEHLPVSETEIDTASATPQFPQDATAPADTSFQEETPHTQAAVGASNEASQHTQNTSQEAEQKNDPGTVIQDHQDVPTAEPVAPYLSSSLAVEEEVRPFTDFIEEFRQSEARFSDSVQKYQSSPLSASPSIPEEVDTGRAEEHTTSVPTTPVTHNVDEVEAVAQQTPAQASTIEHTPAGAEVQTPVASETTETTPTMTPPATRPVSPLLRPATPRGRTPRHTGSRHHETPPVAATPTATPVETAETAPTADTTPISAEPSAEEQPRPARRYRFDRPSKVNTPSVATTPPTTSQTPLPARADENKDVVGRDTATVPFRPTNGHAFNGQISEKESAVPQQVKQAAPTPQQVTEPPVSKQPAAPELPVVENTPAPGTPSTQEDRRRRHGQDRQRVKEQPQSATAPVTLLTPAMEVVPPIAVSTTPVAPASSQDSEVSAEDLPPLEYSELQKASSRRRRRRHTPGSVATATANTPLAATPKAVPVAPELLAPVAPAPVVTAPPLPPVAPASPVVTPRSVAAPNTAQPASSFTLTSGYTVNQMNQTHEGRNPFMGPDPSPARGTQAAQNVRSIRTDAQRTPAYPVRTTEATSASVHQLANVVSQAIQTQTDRMIAELRRSNQGPTNISVSMPPFPSNERVGVFVDVANLLYSARTLRMTVDFGKLLDFLRGNRRLVRAQAYCPTSPQPGDEQMFLQAVKGLGYRITTKNYKTFSSGAKKADLDLDLCMDVVRLVDGRAVDCIVLVSGDSDFMPMLDYCSDHGVRVEVAAFDEAMSATLRQSCDLFINLSMLEEIRV